jgi:hypothetical protein
MSKKICLLEYTSPDFENCFNLGDDIQTLAASYLLPDFGGYASRESLNLINDECIVILNGYFMASNNWPPSPSVKPVFFGFHVRPESKKAIFSQEGIEYLKKWQPIGCRDIGTMNAMLENGIEAFYSRCLSLTFPKRKAEPTDGKIYIVGVDESIKHIIPKSIRSQAIRFDQSNIPLPVTNTRLKSELAKALLEVYSLNAKLVITSKLHCAMPCIAMGIPVVFLYEKSKRDDYRIKIINDFIDIHYVNDSRYFKNINKYWLSKKIDWEPDQSDIEPLKEEIKSAFYKQFDRILSGT